MSNTNWFIGIDEGSSTPGGTQVSLPNYVFVDGSFVGASDGSPDAPYKHPNDAIAAVGANAFIVIAAGTYVFTASGTTTKTGLKFLSNQIGSVFFTSDNPANQRLIADNDALSYRFIGINFVSVLTPRLNVGLRNCTFDQSGWNGSIQVGGYTQNVNLFQCVLINTDVLIAGRAGFEVEMGHDLNRCTFVGTAKIDINASNVNNYTLNIIDCDFDSGYDIDHNNSLNIAGSNFDYSNFRGTITNIDLGTVLPQGANNKNVDPLWVGDPTNYELLVQEESPLIGSGIDNSTIGAFKVGDLVNLSSPAENNNITVGPPITITNPATSGNIKPQFFVFSEIRKSPLVSINGILDGLNDIPDSENDLILPERYTLEIAYKSTFGGVIETKNFIYGLPMYLDNSGIAVGEDNFNPFDISSTGDILNNPDKLSAINLINVAEIQPNFELIDK